MLMPTIPEKLAAANAEGSALRHEETNPALIENVVKAVTALFPMASSDNKTRIEVSNVRVDTKCFDADALAKWQDARQQTKTIGGSILADLVLIRDDKVAQRLNGFRLGQLPLMGALGTFMTNGNDYFTPMQLRLKPGAYTREKTNGEYETFIPAKGANLKVYMDPATGVFKLEVFSSNVSWYALVRSLGTTDEQILDVWGNTQASRELLERNKVKNSDKDLEKFFKTIFEKKQNRDLIRAGIEKRDISLDSVDKAGQVTAVKTWMSSQKLDPYVTKKTLGEGLDSLSPQVLLQASRRIIEVSKNTHEPDDRDAIEFKTLHHVDDMLPERIKKLGRSLTRRLLMRLSKPGTTLAKGFGSNWLNPATVGFFGGSRGIEGGMANTAEAANPLAILSEHSKITLTGEGGIGSSRAITTDARLFRPGSSNFIDLVHTPEGAEIGISTHTAWNTRKRGNVLEALFLKVENGIAKTPVWVSAELANDSIVSYPEYWNIEGDGKPNEKLVRANKKGAIELVSPSEVQYVIPSGRSMFDHTSNASIFFDATSANRGMMSGKHMTQALPLVNREHPLVTLVDGRGNSVMETLAKTFTIRSKVDGVVTKVTPTEIVVGSTVHEIFNQYAMQAKVALNHIAVVKVGDRVSKGQLIADSNYSKDGKLALGVNVHTAYMPWKGALNYEDAIVISESAAKKFSSEHVHREELELLPGITVDKKLTQAQFPTLFTADSFKKLEENGVIKEGSRIDPGQVLIAAVKKVEFDEHDRSSKNLSSIHKILQRPYRNASITWTEIFPATVYRVVRTAESITVHLTTHEPMQVGDKLSMSSAAKGTVSAIIADDKMPRTKKGEHIEVILSPHGVVGRVNPSQTLEQAAGKLVKITGKKYEATNFGNINLAKDISDKLDKAGISHEEVLFDPETGKDIEKPVGVGYNYMIKLDHAVRKKFSARERDGYTMDETPTRGKGVGGQSYDHLTTYALLGHNAHAILGESAGIRGTKHDEFWHAFQAGELPPPPKVPFVFEKFRAFLNAAGVDTQQRGNTLHYLPMSETRVRAQSNGEIKEGTLIKSKDLAEEKNGLFDPAITGGLTGDKFAHIELNERIPQPLYEKTIRDVLGLKTAEYYGLIAHTKFWNTVTKKFQDEASRDALTGEEAFKNLMNFNIADKLEEAKRGLRTAVGSDANKLNRAARYLRGLQETKLTPFDAYMTKAVAVLPPKYRPIIEMSGGALRVADSNLMYRDVILTNDALAQAKAANMPADALATARTTLYQSVGALIGVNNALTHRDDREDAQGLIDTIKGKSNKTGMFQRLIVAHRNDYSGRSTIEPDANLGVDEIGIPEEMAWKLYKPMIVRRLSQLGNKPSDAMEAVEKRTLAARQALDEEMKNRPVLYNRAPSLHRWSVAAAFPRISAGKEIKISPLVVGPLGADFDGNCCIGQTTLTLTFDGISSMDMLQEKYAMRAIGSTKLLSTTPDGLIVLMAIQDVPRTGAGMRDKNGAMVYAVKPGISVLSALPGGGTRFSAVTGVTVEDGCSLMEVVTNGKNSVIVSDNESLVVFDRHTGGILKQKPRAAVDDLVPVVRQFPATEEGTERDYRFGWMFGAFCGDGFFMGGSRRLGFTKLDAPTRNQFEEAMAEFTSASWSGQYAGLKGEDKLGASLKDHYYGDCSVFENCYADVGTFTLEDRACLRKKLPCVMGMDRQFRLGMLAGLLDTDGTVTEVKAASKEKSQLQVMFATSSPYLRDDVIDLCMSLGIRASFTTTKPSSKRLQTHDSYTLSISAVDVKIIAGELRLTCEQKKAVLRKIEVYKFRDSTDPVPVPWKLFDYIRDAKGIFINHQSMLTTLRSLKGKHPFPRVSRETARTVLQVLEKNDLIKENSVFSAWRDIVRDTTVGWERVLSATPKPTERVYDLVIPETKIFAVNGGLIIYDTMSVIPPITEAARLESFKLLPSRNLLFDKDRSLAYGASKDVISGIFALTKPGLPSGKKYESTDAAIAAYHANKDGLLLGSLVTVANRSTPVAIGWLILEKIVPARFLGAVSAPIDGKKLDKILTDIATQSPTDYNTISRQLTQAGFQFAAAAGGITSTIGELNVDRTKIDRLLNQMEHSIAAAGPDKTDRIAAAKKSYDAINPQLEEEVKSHLKTINRGYHSFIESGSNDKKVNQMMQMLASPVMMADIHDQIVPAVVKSSYAQGMRPSDYVLTTPGSRKGLVARSLSTALPGFLAKEVAGNVGDVRIYDKDCNTTRGIEEPLKAPNGLKDHDVDLLDRHLLRDILGTSFKRNDPVTPGLLAQLRDKSVQTIWVRSPMTCQAAKPPCQMCAGRAPTGELWPIGTNIGYNYGQGISERSTQLTMKCSAGLITLATGEVYPFSEFFSRLKSVEEKDMRTAKDGIPALKGRKGEVKALSAQQHPPHDDVYLISTKTGSAMLVQGNHPLFVHPGRVRKNFSNRNLSLIGDERYRQTQAGTRDSNVAFHGELKEMQARDVSTENAIWVDYAPTVVRGTVTPSIDGYLAGYYASEGCIRYGNGTPKYKGVAVATCIALKGNTVIGLKNQARVEKALHGLSYGISGDVINIYSPSFASKIAALVGSHVMPRGVGQSPSNAKVLLGGFSNYADQWLKDFLDGMIDGDGTIFESSGSTVVKICTTSFELATQIMFVARKFDLRSSISATDKSPCRLPQWNTAFNVELRFPKGYVSTSHRVEVMGGIKPMKRKMLRPIRGFDPVSQVKKLTQWRGFVYDVKTSTSEFMLGTIQNHNTFHAGGTVGAGDALMEGFNRLRELLSVPDVIKKQGTLATVNGRVEETRLAPQGGYFVYIGDKRVEHHVQQGRDLIVKNGDVVSAGDPLSTGNFKPQEIAEHKGTLAAQQYVVNQIRRSYQDAGAVVRKPVIEVLAAAMMRTVEVTNDGGEPDLAIGDVIHENDYENRKKRNQKITAKPTLLGLSHKPLQSKDLLARLNFQRLDDAIRDIPSAGGSSDLTGAGSPISGLAYGAAFRPEADSAFNAGVKY